MNGYKSSLEFWTATRFLTISLVTLHVDKIDERYRHFCRSSLLSRSLDLNSVKTGFCPIFIIEYKNDLEFWNSSFDNPSGYVAREQDRWKISPSSSLSRSILFRFCFNFSSNQHRIVYRALEFRTATRPLVTLHADKIDERYRHFCRSSLLSRQLAFDFVKSFVVTIFIEQESSL